MISDWIGRYDQGEQTILPNSHGQDFVLLENGRLDAGKYVLAISDYETEFEIR